MARDWMSEPGTLSNRVHFGSAHVKTADGFVQVFLVLFLFISQFSPGLTYSGCKKVLIRSNLKRWVN
jgi:hypothetical protein